MNMQKEDHEFYVPEDKKRSKLFICYTHSLDTIIFYRPYNSVNSRSLFFISSVSISGR